MKDKSKKSKRQVSYVKELMCPRCKCVTTYSLYSEEKKLYMCSICKNIIEVK